MSPEQCRGIAENIDHRTDIYALGIILYEMLTGAPPFVSPGYGEILMMHMSQTPVPPRQNNPGIPEHIETAILRALAKKREARFGSMLEFQQVLAAGPARTSPGVAVTPPGGFVPAGSGQTLLLPETTTRHPTTFSSTTGEIRKVVGVGKRRTAVVGGAAAALTLGATLLFMMRAGPARKDPEQVPVAGPVRATGEIPSPPPKIEAPVTPPPAATAPAPQKPAPPPAIEIAKSDPVPTKPQPALMAPKPNKAPAKKKVNASVKALPVEVAPSPAPKATPPPVPAKPSVIDQFDKLVGRPTAGKASP
jgi:serine/threonine-protein kinase